jgi:hypothetical protein
MSLELQPPQTGAVARWVASLSVGARMARQWRLLLLWLGALALPTLLMTVPLAMALAEKLNHSLLASQFADSFELTSLVEMFMTLGQNNFSPAAGGLAGLVLMLLLSPWLTGMAMASARAEFTLDFGGLVKGGLSVYWRMARMLLWGFLPLGLTAAAAGGLMKLAENHAEQAILESDAQLWGRLALVASAVLVLLAHATVDAARAQMVIEPRRRSVFLAWWKATRLLVRRPGRVLLYVVLTAIGLALAAAFGLARLNVSASSGLGLIGGLVLGQCLVLAFAWMRCARLFALVSAGRAA